VTDGGGGVDDDDNVNQSLSSCGVKYVCCLCLKCIFILNRHIQSNVLMRWYFHICTMHLDIIKVLFIHQLMQ